LVVSPEKGWTGRLRDLRVDKVPGQRSRARVISCRLVANDLAAAAGYKNPIIVRARLRDIG
jgi:hypothetical protein